MAARRRGGADSAGHDRWLVSYADFITLLFAFFVVMFATSQTDRSKTNKMQESLKRALGGGFTGILGGLEEDRGKGNAQLKGPGGDKLVESRARLFEAMRVLHHQLDQEVSSGAIQLSMEARGLVISFHQAAYFPSGGDEIPAEALESLAQVAGIIRGLPNAVRFEGHTDPVPLRGNGRFRTNWDLSAGRAIAMMEALVDCCGLSTERFSVAGFAENQPVADNSTEEGRARNRRVDIVIENE